MRSTGVVAEPVRAALTSLRAAIDVLASAHHAGSDDDGILDVARELEVQRRRLPTLDHALVVELECRSVAAKHLHRGTPQLLAALLHLDLPEARSRVRAAADLGPRTAVSGAPLPPAHPVTAAAQAAGRISSAHALVITRAVHDLPTALEPDVVAAAEADLAGLAPDLSPSELTRAAERLAAHLDPDGSLPDDDDRARRRHLTIGAQGADGMTPVRGLLDARCRALLDAAITALARPTTVDDLPDPRSAGQRNHDALAALCQQLLAAGALPDSRGLAATVVVTVTLDQLEQGLAPPPGSSRTPRAGPVRRPDPLAAPVRTATGTRLSVGEALTFAAGAHRVLAVFDHDGQPLFLSRTRRLANPGLRLALIARDRGCTRPGCDAPASWTEVHHLTEWRDGGKTDVDNLALVCSFDHHLITREGFTVRMGPAGRVQWIAPVHLDPTRTPRVNPLHHPPDLRPATGPELPST